MYLLDAVVVAELRGARDGRADPGLVAWASEVPRHDLHLSALSLMELQGIGRGEKVAAAATEAWIAERVMVAFDGRILPIDAAVVRRAATLAYADLRDALLVASALEHRLTLVTRHVSAYKAGRPKLFSPWGYVPREDGDDWREAARGGSQWFKNLFVRV